MEIKRFCYNREAKKLAGAWASAWGQGGISPSPEKPKLIISNRTVWRNVVTTFPFTVLCRYIYHFKWISSLSYSLIYEGFSVI